MLRYIFPASLLLAAVLPVAGCGEKRAGQPLQETFPVASPIYADTVYAKEFVADLQAVQNVGIRSRVKGFIDKVHVDEGQLVKAGQLLFSVSAQEYADELQRAVAGLKNAAAAYKSAKVEADNTRMLAEKKIVSKTVLEQALAKLEAADADVDEAKSAVSTARLNLSFTAIKAPFDGFINRIPNKTGSVVEEGMLLTTISDNKEVYAYFNVSEREYLDFVRQHELGGNTVSLVLADGRGHESQGRIETIDGEFDRATGNIAFRARFANPKLLIRHGATGKVKIGFRLENAVLIPQRSTFEIQDKLFVYIADRSGRLRMKAISVRQKIPHFYVLEGGLKPTDRFLFDGIQYVRNGDVVRTREISAGEIRRKLAE
jgi:RND family efflux transporter MFP subunit